MLLVKKWPFFQSFFFKQFQSGKCLLRYSRTSKRLSRFLKKRSSNSRKMDIFFKGVNPCFWSKNGHFSNFFFSAIQARKMSFTIFQIEKTRFQAIKTKCSKSHKIDIFQRGLPMLLVQRWPFFQLFFQAILVRKMYFTLFQNEQTPFQAFKKKKFKKSKN